MGYKKNLLVLWILTYFSKLKFWSDSVSKLLFILLSRNEMNDMIAQVFNIFPGKAGGLYLRSYYFSNLELSVF